MSCALSSLCLLQFEEYSELQMMRRPIILMRSEYVVIVTEFPAVKITRSLFLL
jgi:hypothetical protein